MKNLTENCGKCNQKLIDLKFDKCMYCGEPLPENLRLTSEEKKKQQEEKQSWYEENEAEQREIRKRKKQEKTGSDSWYDDSISGDVDCGGCD